MSSIYPLSSDLLYSLDWRAIGNNARAKNNIPLRPEYPQNVKVYTLRQGETLPRHAVILTATSRVKRPLEVTSRSSMECPGAPRSKRHYRVEAEPIPAPDFGMDCPAAPRSERHRHVEAEPIPALQFDDDCPRTPPRKHRELVCPGAPRRR